MHSPSARSATGFDERSLLMVSEQNLASPRLKQKCVTSKSACEIAKDKISARKSHRKALGASVAHNFEMASSEVSLDAWTLPTIALHSSSVKNSLRPAGTCDASVEPTGCDSSRAAHATNSLGMTPMVVPAYFIGGAYSTSHSRTGRLHQHADTKMA